MKIGDKVKWLRNGKHYEIIADRKTPYKGQFGDMYPSSKCDYLLRALEKGKFVVQYINAVENELEALFL